MHRFINIIVDNNSAVCAVCMVPVCVKLRLDAKHCQTGKAWLKIRGNLLTLVLLLDPDKEARLKGSSVEGILHGDQ